MSQNVPNKTETDNDVPAITRLQQTAHKRIIQNKTYTQIAEDLGVDRRTLQRDRAQYPDLYTYFLESFLDIYKNGILQLADSEEKYQKLEGLKEMGRMIRSSIPKRIESKNLSLSLSLEETRASNAWIEHLTPTEFDNFQQLKNKATSRITP